MGFEATVGGLGIPSLQNLPELNLQQPHSSQDDPQFSHHRGANRRKYSGKNNTVSVGAFQ